MLARPHLCMIELVGGDGAAKLLREERGELGLRTGFRFEGLG